MPFSIHLSHKGHVLQTSFSNDPGWASRGATSAEPGPVPPQVPITTTVHYHNLAPTNTHSTNHLHPTSAFPTASQPSLFCCSRPAGFHCHIYIYINFMRTAPSLDSPIVRTNRMPLLDT